MILIQGGSLLLIVPDERRAQYIDALEHADNGSLDFLVKFFVATLKQEFIHAFGGGENADLHLNLRERVELIGEMFSKPQDDLQGEVNDSAYYARELHDLAMDQLKELQDHLKEKIHAKFTLSVDEAKSDNIEQNNYFRNQIIHAAKKLNYKADTAQYRSWVRMCIIENFRECSILVSFHGIGVGITGVLVCSAIWFEKMLMSRDEFEIGNIIPICTEVFLINPKQNLQDIRLDYEDWLDSSIERGLTLWQDSLLKDQNHG